MIIEKFFDFFKKKQEPVNTTPPKEFNIDDFNNWFNTIYSGYSGTNGSPGIFLRTDKLGQNMIEDYLKYLGHKDPQWEETNKYYNIVRKDWMNKQANR